ncbi:MAG: hypothetical protein CYPHOPRED_005998 [Cyphobasidiales sp. Tagirdzhanova-0007]|nr:MAG: hypothetical protein CYPHOPRED_005998 [Cyphobasidiales sp. Tagirdzhanova-0007]
MPQVIDLTDEGDGQSSSGRSRNPPVDLTDDTDDVQFVSETRLHLPAQAHSRGNDSTPDFPNGGGGGGAVDQAGSGGISWQRCALRLHHGGLSCCGLIGVRHLCWQWPNALVATLNALARPAHNAWTIFSRGAGVGSSSEVADRSGLYVHQEDPLLWNASSGTRGLPSATNGRYVNATAGRAMGPAGEAAARRTDPPPQRYQHHPESAQEGLRYPYTGNVPAPRPRHGTPYRGIMDDPRNYAYIPDQHATADENMFQRLMNAVPVGASAMLALHGAIGLGGMGRERWPAGRGRYSTGFDTPNFGSAVPASLEAKRRNKKYSTRQSHPNHTRKMAGFSREIIPPPEFEPKAGQVEADVKGKGRALIQDEEELRATSKKANIPVSLSLSPNEKQMRIRGNEQKKDEDQPLPCLPESRVKPREGSLRHLRSPDMHSASSSSSSSPMSALDSQASTSSINPSSTTSNTTSVELHGLTGRNIKDGTLTFDMSSSSSSSSTLLSPRMKTVDLPEAKLQETRTVLAPVCASCLSPLYLTQSTLHRPYLLLCAHVVCCACLTSAKERCDEWSRVKKRGGWTGTPTEKFEEVIPVRGGSKGKRKRMEDSNIHAAPADAICSTSTTKLNRCPAMPDLPASQGTSTAPPPFPPRPITRLRASARPRRAALAASAMDLAESSGDDDIPVPGLEDPSYRPGADLSTYLDEDDEMNDGPRQPASSVLSISAVQDGKFNNGRTRSRMSAKASRLGGKPGKEGEPEVEVDPNWLSCPIVACRGHQTDLLAPLGSKTGAWEMFV